MKQPIKKNIEVQGTEITILLNKEMDFVCISDMVKKFEGGTALIEQWLKNKDTIHFLGVWEQINNPNFNSPEFIGIKNEAGVNRFYISIKKWIEKTNAIGLIASAGRYGGTFAHMDIAFEFGSWLSPEFKLYLIKEFQRLKEEENNKLNVNWDLKRTLAKINYKIHTDAIKEKLIPKEIMNDKVNFIYADEADLLNIALFGTTAKEWPNINKEKSGNIRDYASIEQLVVLSNLESINALLIKKNISKKERLEQLNISAIAQMKSLLNNNQIKKLK